MIDNSWIATHKDDGFNELLSAVAKEGIEALNDYKHKQIELKSFETAFFISQRILLESRNILGEDSDDFMDLLIRSIESCLIAEYLDVAVKQASYAQMILEKSDTPNKYFYPYVLGVQSYCYMKKRLFKNALNALDKLKTLQTNSPEYESLSTSIDTAVCYAGLNKVEEAIQAYKKLYPRLAGWISKFENDKGEEADIAFSLCAYSIDACMSILSACSESEDASWALNTLLYMRGKMWAIKASVTTIHSPDGDVYKHARTFLKEGQTFLDCVRYENMLKSRQEQMLFYRTTDTNAFYKTI